MLQQFQGLMTSADENQYGDMYFYDGTVLLIAYLSLGFLTTGLGDGVSLRP